MDDIKKDIQFSKVKDITVGSTMNGKDDFEFPETFEGFGYKFNDFGQLRHIITGEPFNFNVKENDNVYNQRRYEAIGELVTDYVYKLLTEAGLQMLKVPIDARKDDASTVIFHTNDAFTNEKLVILIHGSGVVRAGQWARRLIINDCLNTGTQIPFIKRAIGMGYGVLVLNTNDNTKEVGGIKKKVVGSETAENHGIYVWGQIIKLKAAAKYIAIVAHSYGGIVAVEMCKKYPESFRKKVIGIAFTDSAHSLVAQQVPQPLMKWLREVSRNWVSSNQPLDTPLILDDLREVECYSAGTQRHDLTSWQSFCSIYEFIDTRYKRTLMAEKLMEL